MNWWDQYPAVDGASPAPASAPAPAQASPNQPGPAAGGNWWDRYERLDGGAAEAPASPPAVNPLEAAGAAAGAGFGKTVLNLQGLVGRGLQAAGAQGAGDWLVNDAEQGKATLAQQAAPYEASNPIASAVGKLGGELVAALPVGGVLGAGVRAAGAPVLGEAIASGGLRAAGAGLPIRAAGGAIAGGASAGLVNPDDAAIGAAIGAGLPLGVRGAGQLFNRVGQAVRGPEVPAGVQRAAQEAIDSGFVVSPSQVNPTLGNQLVEGLGGKARVAQQMSVKNQDKVNAFAREELGMKAGEEITPEALTAIRRQAGQAYDAVAGVGTVQPTKAYDDALDDIIKPYVKASEGFKSAAPNQVIDQINQLRTPAFDASSGIAKIRELRDLADAAYRRGDKDVGRALKRASGAIEDAIETHLKAFGADAELVTGFKNARQTIAKTYSVESALNGPTGNVSARKLATQKARGKALSGNLDKIARAAEAFPKNFQDPATIGGVPALSRLDYALGVGGGVVSAPFGVALAAAGPFARAAAMSKQVQAGLARSSPAAEGLGLGIRHHARAEALQGIGLGLPVALSSRDR